jgi:signal transduction histidine kinase
MEPKVIIFGTSVILVMAFGIISFVLVYMRRQQQQQEEMTRINEIHQRNLLEASVDSQENVRRQIGGDLHDDIGTLLSATRMQLSLLGKQIKDNEPANEFFTNTNELLNDAITNVRRISKELMPATLDKFGLEIGLKEFAEKFSSVTGVDVSFHANGIDESSFSKKIALIFFRIVQELVNNSLKHAEASKINIELTQNESQLQLQVADNGKGFDLEEVMANPKTGIGIRNIESRLSVINGTVNYDIAKGKGAKINIEVKLTHPSLN